MAGVQRDLLPAPLPFPDTQSEIRTVGMSRSVRRRLERRSHWQLWANDAVACINDLAGVGMHSGTTSSSRAQLQCLDRIADTYRRVGLPEPGMTAAGAFTALCGSRPGYAVEDFPRSS